MSGQLLVFGGSLAGVALLVLAAWVLRLGGGARIADEAEARELANHAMLGFDAREVALDAKGRGALLRDGGGQILLLAPHGAHFVARQVDPALQAVRRGNRITLLGIPLDLGAQAEAWAGRLGAADG
ncbi:MAG: hypothetical protein P0Y56_11420 [Candidatus Andeanibacterium colombiense]|uniref:Uncharacterized protein n=1 Tax=Candidatus Andeanibacterium colombiense TaxID=3121345 RepID=A0AAJ6BNH6_9SPHN|nr:MAG: hypothetical protein P0Y56_11420 [Sphingomonadaceae bacterium]